MLRRCFLGVALLSVTSVTSVTSPAGADPLTCDMSAYKAVPGLAASLASDLLTATWTGDAGQELRLRFSLVGGSPTILELAVRKPGGAWGVLASNAKPDFRVVSGLRRMSNQQIAPLRGLGVELTAEIVDRYRWEPFWDAPLNVPGGMPDDRRTIGLPRKPEEVHRATATYKADSCEVKTDKTHLTVTFPGVSAMS